VRVAVLSDIHGNLHALDAVLEAIDAEPFDELWFLGDLVGYGPRPNRCYARVAGRLDVALVGNHDLAALGELDLDFFQPDAALSARWTSSVLEPETATFLASLSPSATRPGAELYHASPRDPVWEYVLSPAVALAALEATEAPIILVGHSHVPLALSLDGDRAEGDHAPGGTEVDLGDRRWLLNPGSVGQPRDGDPRAAWLALDLGAGRATFNRVTYPVERTQEEIRERGLPETLAARLEHGA
jgi:diadenosine tetraphosphatase ApaH/serine/threonine PP2A family protein phosphatase